MNGSVGKENTASVSTDSSLGHRFSSSMNNCHSHATMEAILTRDQRTTSHRVVNDPTQTRSVNSSISWLSYVSTILSVPSSPESEKSDREIKLASRTRTSVTDLPNASYSRSRTLDGQGEYQESTSPRSSKRIRRCTGLPGPSGFTNTWTRVSGLLVTLFVASINAAPTMNSEDTRLTSALKWVNPCGLPTQPLENDSEMMQLDDNVLVTPIYIQAKTALSQTEIFRDKYVNETFCMPILELHAVWQKQKCEWLPSSEAIPDLIFKNNNLPAKLSEEFLSKLDLDTALLDAFEYMQKYAVGMEQLVWDQEDNQSAFREYFVDAELKLRLVLCEIQVALLERGVTPRPDITRSVMPEKSRSISNGTHRNVRDWLIFRDYMNGIEFISQVFDHFCKSVKC